MSKSRGRGFAAMDPERLRELASKGGKTSQAKGTAHRFRSKAEASRLGKIGGLRSGLVRGKKPKDVWAEDEAIGGVQWPRMGLEPIPDEKKAAPPAHAREADDAAAGTGSSVEAGSIAPDDGGVT